MVIERRQSDLDLREIRESQIRTETLLKEVVRPAIEQVYLNEGSITVLKTNLKNHEKTHYNKHQDKRDNKSTVAIIVSGLIAIVLLVKTFILDKIH